MLLAVSDAVVTGTAAVLGALVGVAAGGLVDTMLESRRERARAKAGARLVAHDLDTAATVLKSLEDDAMWFPFQQIEMVAWPEYRDVLALRLTNDQFDSVSGAVTGIVYFMQGGQAIHERKLGQPSLLSPAAVKQAHRARADMTEAYNALAKLAGHAPVVLLPVEQTTEEPQTAQPSKPLSHPGTRRSTPFLELGRCLTVPVTGARRLPSR